MLMSVLSVLILFYHTAVPSGVISILVISDFVCKSLLGVFAKLRKPTISFVMSVCPSAHTEQFGSQLMDFHEILCLNVFQKIRVSLKYDKNNGYFTWRSIYIFGHISPKSSRNVADKLRNVADKRCRENQNIHFIFNAFFFNENSAVYEIMWKNIVEQDGPQMTMEYSACALHAAYLRLQTPTQNM